MDSCALERVRRRLLSHKEPEVLQEDYEANHFVHVILKLC
jgi:hypothetical protein